jgi:APA family basic amino acid/polyamine antiporter
MLGVLLNLILGLSRVMLAMGRQGDLPPLFARVSVDGGILVAILAAFGSVESAWAFSAFSVLIYYAITNLAALRLPREQRMFPPWIAIGGLAACLFLAFWVPVRIWLVGFGLIAIGLAWKAAMPRLWTTAKRGVRS